jgi:putative DNA primase/helicase
LQLATQKGGGLNFFGPSSAGKTTLLQAAASVWGRGASPGYIRTWRATANGLEGAAAGATDTALVLDEFGVVEARDAAAAFYGLANGSGKARAARDGSLREPKSWRVLILSSGEIPAETKLLEEAERRPTAPTAAPWGVPCLYVERARSILPLTRVGPWLEYQPKSP